MDGIQIIQSPKTVRKTIQLLAVHVNAGAFHFLHTHPTLQFKIQILLFYNRFHELVTPSLACRNFLPVHFSLMASNSSRILKFHNTKFASEILSRPMNSTVNVEHIFCPKPGATNLTRKWSANERKKKVLEN